MTIAYICAAIAIVAVVWDAWDDHRTSKRKQQDNPAAETLKGLRG